MLFLTISLLFSAPAALAANFCASLEQLHDHVFFCEDNVTYAKFADSCKEQFRALAQAKSLALRKTLTETISSANGEAQTTHFKTTESSYESTDRALGQAIVTGRQARGEVVAYGDDFVAPFAWPWMDLGPWPGLHHPKVQELFRSQGCYKESIESVERTTAEFDQMIHDLETTRTITAQLHQRASGRELNLADLNAIPMIGAHALKGQSSTGASDITGTGRDKGPSLTSGLTGAKLRDPGFSASSSGNLPSDITRSAAAPLKASDAAKLFSTNLNPSKESSALDLAAGKGIPESVGSALWGASNSDAKTVLALVAESSPAPKIETADSASGLPSVDGLRSPASLSSTVRSSPGLAGPDRDLFTLVHDRYRASDLFRKEVSKD